MDLERLGKPAAAASAAGWRAAGRVGGERSQRRGRGSRRSPRPPASSTRLRCIISSLSLSLISSHLCNPPSTSPIPLFFLPSIRRWRGRRWNNQLIFLLLTIRPHCFPWKIRVFFFLPEEKCEYSLWMIDLAPCTSHFLTFRRPISGDNFAGRWISYWWGWKPVFPPKSGRHCKPMQWLFVLVFRFSSLSIFWCEINT